MARRLSRFIMALFALIAGANAAVAEGYHREELRLPMAGTGGKGLEAVLIRPEANRRYPLVIISHGTPRKAEDRVNTTASGYHANAVEFARRGFAVVTVVRRGYGNSGGDYAENSGSCSSPNYVRSARAGAQDIKAAIDAIAKRDDIDATRIVAVGQSAGGLATVALTADPPKGLVAAISFAGGHGSKADYEVCNESRLVDAFGSFGKTSRLPMLWVYSENDHYFAPALAAKFRDAFTASGGRAEFIRAPAFGEDGHRLFSTAGIARWTPYVDAFFARNGLAQQPVAPLLVAELSPPAQLSQSGLNAFASYLREGPHKAFAVASKGAYGFSSNRRSADEAKERALKLCSEHGPDCRVMFVDDAATR